MKHDSEILKRIKSYFMHRRSAKEAHTFEREAERDQFLYEAIEGYEDMLTSDIQQALDELDDRLDEQTNNRWFYVKWQIAAAVAVILVGAGIFTYLGQRNVTETGADMSLSDDDENTRRNQYSPREDVPHFSEFEPIPESETISTIDSNRVDGITMTEEIAPTEAKVPLLEPALKESAKTASSMRADEELVAMDDSEQKKQQDLVSKTASETTGFESAVALSHQKRSTEPLARASSSEESLSVMADPVSASSSAPSTNAVPQNGMDAYQRYLKNALQRTPGMPSGKVVLQFEFDRSGKPKKIEVLESLCTPCDLEAMRLVEEGPVWEVGDRKEPQRLEVEFK